MGLAQISKQIGQSVEQELTLIFASMGDSRLPEAAHRCPTNESLQFEGALATQHAELTGVLQRGMDASGHSSPSPQNTSH